MNSIGAAAASLKAAGELASTFIERWGEDKQRYSLRDVGNGCMAYVLREDAAQGEPEHTLCPNCFQDGAKRIMAPRQIPEGRAQALSCTTCQLELIVGGVDLREANRNARRR